MKKFIAALALIALAPCASAKDSVLRKGDVIYPLQGEAVVPLYSRGFEIVFERALDFDFMSNNSNAAAQVFKYLPIAVANGLSIDKSHVVVTELRAFPLVDTSDYVATSAIVYVPDDTCEDLLEQLRTPESPIFTENSGAAAALVRLINPNLSSEIEYFRPQINLFDY